MMMMMMISAPPYYVSARITTAETRMRLALDCREQRRNAFDKNRTHPAMQSGVNDCEDAAV